MQHSNRWMVVILLLIAGLQLSACNTRMPETASEKPARVEPIEGTDLNRVILSEKAAQRLDIQTAPVREEQVVRKRTVAGEVVAFPEAGAEKIPHRIEFTVTDLTKEIAGVRTVVAWVVDYSGGQLVEMEIAFYAQDNDGNVWYLGEYPEEYEDGEFVAAPTWIAGLEDARAGIMMKADPQLGTPSYFQGWGPAVEWTDYGQVDQMGQQTCVPVGCYEDVLVIAESSLDEPDAYQLKYYARGVGNVRVGWRGEDATQEELELVQHVQLDPEALAEVRRMALLLEKHAYERSKDVYAHTPPAVHTPGTEPPPEAVTDSEPLPIAATKPEAAMVAEFADFDPNDFDRSTNIDNEWLPLQPGTRWVYEGFTVEGGPDPSPVWVRVPVTESDLNKVDWSQPAFVRALDRDDGTAGWTAEPDEGPGVDSPGEVGLPGEDVAETLYYLIDSAEHGLASEQPVLVELSLLGSGMLRKVIPYAAVLYGLQGETWTYTSPEPLTFVRQPITVDYIEGDMAVLVDGPPAGTQVATVGVAELYGAETGVGK